MHTTPSLQQGDSKRTTMMSPNGSAKIRSVQDMEEELAKLQYISEQVLLEYGHLEQQHADQSAAMTAVQRHNTALKAQCQLIAQCYDSLITEMESCRAQVQIAVQEGQSLQVAYDKARKEVRGLSTLLQQTERQYQKTDKERERLQTDLLSMRKEHHTLKQAHQRLLAETAEKKKPTPIITARPVDSSSQTPVSRSPQSTTKSSPQTTVDRPVTRRASPAPAMTQKSAKRSSMLVRLRNFLSKETVTHEVKPARKRATTMMLPAEKPTLPIKTEKILPPPSQQPHSSRTARIEKGEQRPRAVTMPVANANVRPALPPRPTETRASPPKMEQVSLPVKIMTPTSALPTIATTAPVAEEHSFADELFSYFDQLSNKPLPAKKTKHVTPLITNMSATVLSPASRRGPMTYSPSAQSFAEVMFDSLPRPVKTPTSPILTLARSKPSPLELRKMAASPKPKTPLRPSTAATDDSLEILSETEESAMFDQWFHPAR